MLPPVKRITDQVLADLGIPRSVLVYINYPTRFDSTQHPEGARGDGHLGAAAAELRRQALGLLGAQPRPRPVQGPLALGRDRGQDRDDHRRLVGDRQGGGDQGRRGRGDGAAGRAHARRSWRRPRPRSRRPAARRTSTAPTSPTSRTSSGWPTEVLAEHGQVDILVNNAGRSIRRSIEHSYDRFHDFERTMQLNYFGSLKLILSLLPAMRKTRQGRQEGRPHHQRQLDRRADQHAALLGLRRLARRARRLVALRRLARSSTTASTSRRSTCRWCGRR